MEGYSHASLSTVTGITKSLLTKDFAKGLRKGDVIDEKIMTWLMTRMKFTEYLHVCSQCSREYG